MEVSWTPNSVSVRPLRSDPVFLYILFIAAFPHAPFRASILTLNVLPVGLCKGSLLYMGSVLLRNLALIHFPFRSSFRGISPLSFFLPHLNSHALLFSFEHLLSVPKPLFRLWLLVVVCPCETVCSLGAGIGPLLSSYSWFWHIVDPQIQLDKWMDNEWMNMPTWIDKLFRDYISHSQHFAKSRAFWKTEI